MRAFPRLVASICLAVLMAVAMGHRAAAAEQPLPTPKELGEMYDAKQYRTCLQQIARVLRVSGDAAKPYDRFALLLLRGDCLLQLRDRTTAMSAFAAAEKSDLLDQATQARAVSLLLSNSLGLTYTPRGAGLGQTLDVADAETRRQAILDLFKSQFEAARPEIDAAQSATNLAPLLQALPTLRDLFSLERAGTGADAQTRPILRQLGQRARTLITNELEQLDQKIAATEKNANAPVELGVPNANSPWWWAAGRVRRGLTSADRDDLRGWIDYAQKIVDVSQQGAQVARSFGADGVAWDPVISKAVQVRLHADDVLSAE